MTYIIIDDETNEVISIDDSDKQTSGLEITHRETFKDTIKIWVKRK